MSKYNFFYFSNKISIFLIVILLFFLYGPAIFAREIDYFNKSQTGFWFGISTPVYTTYESVATTLTGGGFFRYNMPVNNLKLGLESSYHFYEYRGPEGVNTLTLWPVYGDFVYRLPQILRIPLTFQLKAGAGGAWVKIRPDRVNQWDPMGIIGFEGSFAAGRILNIGFRIDYLFIYEQYIKDADRNGHVLDTGITLFFNI